MQSELDFVALKNRAAAFPALSELWSYYTGYPDTDWTVVNPGSGAWTLDVDDISTKVVVYPAATQLARIITASVWPMSIAFTQANIHRGLHAEWSMNLSGSGYPVANIDEALTWFGFGWAATRADNDLVGFAILGDALQTVTDLGGTEETHTGFGESLLSYNRYGIHVLPGAVYFTLNDIIIATHTTNVPWGLPHWQACFASDVGGPSELSIGPLFIWPELNDPWSK